MGDLLGVGVLATDLGDADITGLAGLGKGIVAAVEVLALLELVLEQVLLIGKLAIEAEKAGFIRRHFADVHLVLLVRVHDCEYGGRRCSECK